MSNPYQQQPPDPYGSYGQPQQPYTAPQHHQAAYPQPGYQQPGYGYPQPPVAQAPQNSLAIASLALGFLSILICFYGALLGPVGLGLGIAGLSKSKQTGVGRTQAIGGVLLSTLGILIGIAGLVFYSTVSENYTP
ncbi:hypothetical protein KCMC57_up39800 [Kitasatospora sp. CMC57]|uniref:DUF4190 domain-containing protein n=1 Tax=Kitasatospora sp. CMC57 TaxID=3231513 RepID=A0AB33K1M7_9ACTN